MTVKIKRLKIPDLVEFTPDIYVDKRGCFYESYKSTAHMPVIKDELIQDNVSVSKLGVLRGLHYQIQNPQGKLITCLKGMIYDVAVDIRVNSPTFGRYQWIILSDENKKSFWIPPGFAHGFLGMEEENIIQYKCTNIYNPSGERTLKWDDKRVAIKWPGHITNPIISEKDQEGKSLKQLKEDGDLFV